MKWAFIFFALTFNSDNRREVHTGKVISVRAFTAKEGILPTKTCPISGLSAVLIAEGIMAEDKGAWHSESNFS